MGYTFETESKSQQKGKSSSAALECYQSQPKVGKIVF
jgi:hypothetical protein